MSILQANGAGLGGAGDPGGALAGGVYGTTIDQSLRFDGSTAYLSKNDFGTATDTNIRTFSTWIKQSDLSFSDYDAIIGCAASNIQTLTYYSDNTIGFYNTVSGVAYEDKSAAIFRDTGAWFHIFFTHDHTAGEVKLYINGSLTKGFSEATHGPTEKLAETGHITTLMKRSNAGQYVGAYLAETVLLDGTVGDINDFAEDINGIWVPKNISAAGLTYGNNGFYLDYADSSDLGKDVSGNGNDFTANNLAASDVVPDSPTNNFATWNPLDKYNYNAPSEGNLRALTAGNNGTQNSTFAVSSGKWYWEARNITADSGSVVRLVGIAKEDTNLSTIPYNNSDCYLYYAGTGNKYNGSSASYGDSWGADGDIIGVALDMDNGAIWFSKNGTWQNSATAAEIAAGTTTNAAFTGLSGTFVMMVSKTGGTSSNDPHHANFGQDSTFAADATTGSANAADDNGIGDFYYTPPSGFLALCSANLPEPDISPNAAEQADDYFNTVLYTGTGASNSITGVGFQPDWTWIKGRSNADYNYLVDSVRGYTERLFSNLTDGASVEANTVASSDSDGFTLGTDAGVNRSSSTYVAWNWKAGGTAVSNTDGSITSSVSAAPDAGFAVGTYTGNATAGATIGHSLGEIPEMVIVKRRTNARDWAVYHKDQSATPTNAYLLLNSTAAVATGNTAWNNGTFTSSVFTIGSHELVNFSGDSYVFYAFRGIEGYSAVGKYVGNGSTDGTFVYTGFRPAWVLLKDADSTSDWQMYDSKRYAFNKNNVTEVLEANQSGAETTTINELDLLSNGFKLRSSNTFSNKSSNFIYLAFAEAPFKYANAR